MNEQQLHEVYEMVDNITFSRSKRNISRDFSDGVMMAELIHHYNSKIISLHNYPATNAVSKKIDNWKTLNNKVLKKIGITLSKQEIQNIANAVPNVIEVLLYQILVKFEKPDEEVRLSQQARKFQKFQIGQKQYNKTPQNIEGQAKRFFESNENRPKIRTEELSSPKNQYWEDSSRQAQTTNQQAQQLLDKIEKAYLQLSKLNQLNKVKEQMLLNLQKKLEKVLFT